MNADDTIFALSSGAPPAAIAIIRISGRGAFDAVHALAGRVPPPRRATLLELKGNDGQPLDRGLGLIFPGPGSATGEDLAELHLHGGRAVVRAVEKALERQPGLRRAEPGEFTRRAFANGRIDLNEADGLADLLMAETEWQRRAAAAMAGGGFSRKVEAWRQELLMISALTEAELDFSDEEDVGEEKKDVITSGCIKLHDAIEAMLAMPSAEKLRDGIRVVLGGPPNSGKSTLLNALTQRDAAIVSEIAGTTRDMIEVPVAVDGIPLLFVDTAGLRDQSQDSIEMLGIERGRAALESADLVLWLGNEGEAGDRQNVIEVQAKSDLTGGVGKSAHAIRVSAVSGTGMAELIALVVEKARALLPPNDSFALNRRQRALLDECAIELQSIAEQDDLLIVAEHLRNARISFDALTGRAHTEDMLDQLFGRFCIGK